MASLHFRDDKCDKPPVGGVHTAQGQITLPLLLCCLASLSEQQSFYKRDTSHCGGGRGLQARGCRKLAEGPEHSPALSHQALTPEADQWTALPPLPTAQAGVAVTALGKRIMVIGGA